METWAESVVRNGNVVALLAGIVGALVAHAIASRFEMNNGLRLLAAAAAFAALFLVGRSAIGQRSESRLRNTLIEDAMFSRPEFREIAAKDAGFRTKVRAFLDSLPDSASVVDVREKVVSWTREFMTPPLRAYAGVASDTTGSDLAKFFEDALRELRKDSVACVSFLYGVLDSRLPSELSDSLESRFKKLTVRVAEEGRRSPRPRVDNATANPIARQMVTRLRRAHGTRADEFLALMADPANGLSKPRETCAAAIAVYSTMADMPPSKGGKLMRYMLDRQPVAQGPGGASF